MIPIPPAIRVESTLKTGIIYYFVEESFGVDIPHYFIVLNKCPRNDPVLLLTCASSQVGKVQLRAAKMGYSADTLVKITPSEIACFTQDTIIDCNVIVEKNIPSIVSKLTTEELRIRTEMVPGEIMEKLIKGALLSKQHSENVKKLIRGQ